MRAPINIRFFLKIVIFFFPVLIYVVMTFFILWSGGEFVSLRDVAAYQLADESVLFGRAYRDNFIEYKLISARLRQPEVLALGSSRAMQFRSEMFLGGKTVFYNAGGSANSIYGIRWFLEQLEPRYYPRVLIVPLDPEWFNPHFLNVGLRETVNIDSDSGMNLATVLNLSRLLFVDLIQGKRSLPVLVNQSLQGQDPLYGAPAVGLDALTLGSGFRSDGSRLYGPLMLTPQSVTQRFAEVRDRIAEGTERMEYSDTLDENALNELAALLDFCRRSHIQIITYSPPFPPSIYDEIRLSNHYSYLEDMPDVLREVVSRSGFMYYNFLDGEKLGSDDDFMDGFHGSDYVALNLLVAFADDNTNGLDAVVNIDQLKAFVVSHIRGDLDPFGNVSS